MIPAGAVLTYELRGVAGGWAPVTGDELRTELVTAIGAYLTVEALDVRSIGSMFELMEWPYMATVRVRTREAYAHTGGPESLITHAAYVVTGNAATAGAIGSQLPAVVPSTGYELGPNSPIRPMVTASAAIGDALRNLISPLTGELNKSIVLLGIVAIAGVYLMAGKTTRVGLG